MKASSWVTFTVVRLLAFFVPLAILLLVNANPWLSVILATIIGFCVSYLFLRRPREKVAASIYEVRHRETPLVPADDAFEDAAIDAEETTAAETGPRASAGADSAAPAVASDSAASGADDAGSNPR